MFKNKRFLIILIITAIIFSIIIGLYFTIVLQNEPESTFIKDSEQNSKSKPKDKLKEVNFTLYNRDKTIKWKLTSQSATRFENKGFINLNPLKIKAYRIKDNYLLYSFTAKNGKYMYKEQKLEMTGSIQLEKEDYLLTTDKLTWYQQENIIKGRGRVKINGSSFTLKGNDFKIDIGLNRIIVTGNENKQAYFSWKEKNNETETD